jgi:hypothetical protein
MLGPFLIREYNTKEKIKDKIETRKEKRDNHENVYRKNIEEKNNPQPSTLNSQLF